VTRSRAADDFATIRARLEELRREHELTNIVERANGPEQIQGRVNPMGQVLIAVRRLRDEAG
jgi:hypothetical protein